MSRFLRRIIAAMRRIAFEAQVHSECFLRASPGTEKLAFDNNNENCFMKNPFKRDVVSYKGDEAITPYQRAQQEWDLRIGSARVQARNWRLLAVMSIFVSCLLLIALLFVLSSRKDRVYIAEVTQSGRVVNVAPLMIRYEPNEAQKEYFISNFIELTRSLPLDPVLAKKNWVSSYYYLSDRGAIRMNAYFKQSNPIALLGKKTITIQITDVNPVSASSVHVNWVETTVNTNGQEEGKKAYSGLFTIGIKPPVTQDEILHNPLGIYIVDFNISPMEK